MFKHLGTVRGDVFAAIASIPALAEQEAVDDGASGKDAVPPGEWTDGGTRAARVRQAFDAGSRLPLSRAALSDLLDWALFDPEAPVRGAAWLSLATAWQSDNRAVHLDVVWAAIEKRFSPTINRGQQTPAELAASWLRLLNRCAALAKASARLLTSRGQAARLQGPTPKVEFAMPSDLDSVEKLLDHPFYWRRGAALWEITKRRANTPAILAKVVAMAKRDPSEIVRCQAVFALCILFGKSRDPETLRLLAAIVADELEGNRLRAAAYRALLSVAGKRSELDAIDPREAPAATMGRIDWEYVSACRAS